MAQRVCAIPTWQSVALSKSKSLVPEMMKLINKLQFTYCQFENVFMYHAHDNSNDFTKFSQILKITYCLKFHPAGLVLCHFS